MIMSEYTVQMFSRLLPMKTRVSTASLSKRTVQSKRNIAASFIDISNEERACVTDSIRATFKTVNYAFFTFGFPVNKSVYCFSAG